MFIMSSVKTLLNIIIQMVMLCVPKTKRFNTLEIPINNGFCIESSICKCIIYRFIEDSHEYEVLFAQEKNLQIFAGDKNISILHLSCRTSDLQFSLNSN